MFQDICSAEDKVCVDEISPEPEVCVKPCEGIYASAVKQDVKSAGDPTFLPLLEDYQKYKNLFDDDVHFPTEIKGKLIYDILYINDILSLFSL